MKKNTITVWVVLAFLMLTFVSCQYAAAADCFVDNKTAR